MARSPGFAASADARRAAGSHGPGPARTDRRCACCGSRRRTGNCGGRKDDSHQRRTGGSIPQVFAPQAPDGQRRHRTLGRRSLAVLAAGLLGAGVAATAAPPSPTLPARVPAGARDTQPVPLSAAARHAFEQSCPGFAAAEKSHRGGWTCDSTPAIVHADGQ